MRHTLLALALAAASLAFTSAGHAGASSYGQGYYGHYQQNCITKRVRTADASGRTVTKRVRICQ